MTGNLDFKKPVREQKIDWLGFIINIMAMVGVVVALLALSDARFYFFLPIIVIVYSLLVVIALIKRWKENK